MADTAICAGAVPLVGEDCSQAHPAPPPSVTLKASPGSDIDRFCGGTALPGWKLKVSEPGETENAGGCTIPAYVREAVRGGKPASAAMMV